MPDSASPALPFDPTPAGVESWLAGLPVDNSRERCRLLFAGLQALNARGLDSALHLQILDKIRPLADVESGKLMAAFLGKPLPHEERVRKSAKLSAQFQLELARGYESVVSVHSPEEDESAFARILRGSLLAYEQYILRLALMYEPASSKLWAAVHALLRRAAQAGLDQRKEPGVRAVFMRLLAFRLACPNRFDQQEVRRLHDLLSEHGDLLGMGTEPNQDGVAADFVIDLGSGALPGSAPPAGAASTERRYLFTGALRRRLTQLMQRSTPEAKRLPEGYAARLMVRLGGLPLPAPEQKARQAMVVGGLEAIGGVAAKAARLKAAGGGWAGLGDLELLPLSDHGGAAPLASQSKSSGEFVAETSSPKAIAGSSSGPFGRSEGEYPCTVLRAETPGIYLMETAAKLRSGHLAALNTDNTLLQVGLLGASRAQGGGRLFAFELLANEAKPVRVFSSSLPAPVAGLLAQASREDGAVTLLVPPSKLRSGNSLELDSGGKRKAYCISRLLEATAEFSQFQLLPQSSTPH